MLDLTKLDPTKFQSPVQRGGAPLTPAQFDRRIRASLERLISSTDRTKLQLANPDVYAQVGQALLAVQAEAEANNTFNEQLEAYRAASDRLARYRLADGRREAYEDIATGAFDPETGEPIVERVRVATAVEPLPATIEQSAYDSDGHPTGVEEVPNPVVVKDDAERAAAQANIDATPQEVIDFAKAAE